MAQPVEPNESTKDETQRKETGAARVYVVDGEGDKAFWTKIGAAWPHEDGKSFNIQLSCLPFNGRLVLRDPKVAADDAEAGR
ncbi:hypothetical protein P0R31_40135 [Bradyrhizobium yuanmingense]|uniref:hypothetical protein n=1 Tax=Bradyrhizobium yuanmingense TaxID=108015 RepID=UPI0023B8BA89|nr:hypothetical protein [Bradyrhizobium yuanmingense]MDF0523384.1 hypothetical protein [Bradyrhizobium yuanmingense]